MGLFQRRLRPDSDLSSVATDRLVREYEGWTAHAEAALRAMGQSTEFASKETPMVIDADAFAAAVKGSAVRAEIRRELERRGVPFS